MAVRSIVAVTIITLIAQLAAGQCGTPGVTKTISGVAELAELASCTTYYGNIELASSVSGNASLGGVEVLKGDIKCNNANGLVSFQAYDLEVVEGEIHFTNCPNLAELDFTYLDNVTSVYLTDLPLLEDFRTIVVDIGSLTFERTGVVNQTFYLSEDYATKDIIFKDNPNLWNVEINGYDAEVEGKLSITGSPLAEFTIWGLEKIGSFELRDARSLYTSSGIVNISSGDLTIENVDVGYSLDSLESVAGDLQLFNVTAETHFYGHDNVLNLPALSEVGGKMQIYNNERHTSLFATVSEGLGLRLNAGSVDIAGLIHELPDSINFGEYGVNTSYINFRSSNQFFSCCGYRYLVNRFDEDFYCVENVTSSNDDYSTWELGQQRSTSNGDVVDVMKCKASQDSPQYAEEHSGSSSSGDDSGSSGGSGSVKVSKKTGKLIGAIVGPVCGVLFAAVLAICCRRRKKKKDAITKEPNNSVHVADNAHGAFMDAKSPQQSVQAIPGTETSERLAYAR